MSKILEMMMKVYGTDNEKVKEMYAEENNIPVEEVEDAVEADSTIETPTVYLEKEIFDAFQGSITPNVPVTHKAWNTIGEFSMTSAEGAEGKQIPELDLTVNTEAGRDLILDYSVFLEQNTNDFVFVVKKFKDGTWTNVTRNIQNKPNHGDATMEYSYNNSSTASRLCFKVVDDRTSTGETQYAVFLKSSKKITFKINSTKSSKDTSIYEKGSSTILAYS